MEQTPHKYVTVAYELFTDNAKGIHELVEKAPKEHPFQFISGMGVALDSFEERILALSQGDEFDFLLKVDEAYGPYYEERVLELDKQIFSINGHFDKNTVYPGAVLPMVNSDGNRFHGMVLEVKDNTVVMDLNHPLAGKELHFRGQIVTLRDATDEEIKDLINQMSGESCGGNCEACGGHHGDEEGGCCGGHHDKDHENGCCGGQHHGEEKGCCGGHHHGEGKGTCCCGDKE